MSSRFAAVGLLAGLFVSLPGLAEEASPPPATPAAAEGEAALAASADAAPTEADSSEGESATKAESAEPAQPAAESGASTTGADGAPATAAEAAAAVDIQTEKTKPFDPSKAKPSEIAAYNASAEPDDRIVCKRDRESAGTGARFSQKVCRTVRQWRELGR